jgi:DNA (cytosine-5)-methyltransferase 1
MSIKAIDLFSGAGGLSLAAFQAGVDVISAIEVDNAAAQTYKKNFSDKKELCANTYYGETLGDIKNIKPSELKSKLKLKEGELDLILGGPPCQGFSSHRIKDAGVDDKRNRLLITYFNFVKCFRPKTFLVENVAGLLWKRHKSYLNEFKRLAKEYGYNIHFCDILNAKDYGVPQNRKRVFILGIRNDHEMLEDTFPPKQTHFSPRLPNCLHWIPASSAFEAIPKELYKSYWQSFFSKKTLLDQEQTFELLKELPTGSPVAQDDPCNIHMQPTEMMQQRFADTPLNGSRMDSGPQHLLKCHANGYVGHKDVYGRILIHQPSNTITAGCNNPSKGRFVHPWKNHGMTLRHAARLQSFPDTFIFTGTTTQQATQIGNAVPPLLGRILIETIVKNIKKAGL